MQLLTQMFSDFVKKIELWGALENEYDFRKDQAKAQKKLEEIYEQLKRHFTNETDERVEQVKRFRENLKGKAVPEHISKIIEEEINRFLQMEKQHSESAVTRTYLEYLTSLPYGVTSEENFDIKRAREILDNDHYGLDDIK